VLSGATGAAVEADDGLVDVEEGEVEDVEADDGLVDLAGVVEEPVGSGRSLAVGPHPSASARHAKAKYLIMLLLE